MMQYAIVMVFAELKPFFEVLLEIIRSCRCQVHMKGSDWQGLPHCCANATSGLLKLEEETCMLRSVALSKAPTAKVATAKAHATTLQSHLAWLLPPEHDNQY